MRKTKAWDRLLAALLIAVMAFVSLGNQAWAETVGSSNGIKAAGENSPSNPIHHCAKEDDVSDWSYVYFGSYPQTEVTGWSLTDEIIDAPYDTNGDAEVDGVKYRRVYDPYYEDVYRYFKWEKIKWRVLKNDGTTLFVMADMGLDSNAYNEEYASITWENCSLRRWLNNDFYRTAFSSEEQGAIVEQIVVNEDNIEGEIEGGNDTRDKVYLLSYSEMTKPEYGFCKIGDIGSASRQINASEYAAVMGEFEYAGDYCWCLRSPGFYEDYVAYVNSNGYVDGDGTNAGRSDFAVVPALHINLESSVWSMDGSSTTPANPVHHCTEGDFTEWSYVYFGSYPQKEVTGQELTGAVREAAYDANGDAVVAGVKYRRVDDGIDYQYYKWEKIKWRVLQNDGKTLFALADYGLDAKKYNDESANVEWEGCSLRQWLNDTFYNTAFSKEEQNAVVEQTVVNEGDWEYEIEDGNDTQDKVYLLSTQDLRNSAYGNCEELENTMTASDYAEIMGATRDDDGDCYWWLRSAGSEIKTAAIVNRFGNIISDYEVEFCSACIPALHIDLKSNLWSMGEGGSGTTPGGPTGGDGNGEGGNGSGSSKLTVSTPADQAVKTGESAVFAVNTSGGSSSGLTCQWYYAASQTGAGTPIQGANAFVYTLTNTDASYNGRYYYCVVTDGSTSVASGRAKLTVYFPPTVATPTPSSLSVTEGQSVTFSVSVSGGNPTDYTYQWYYYTFYNSKKHKKIEGAISPTYTIAKAVENQESYNTHYYYCVVSNGIYEVKPEKAAILKVYKTPVEKKTQKITASSFKMTCGSYKTLKARTSGNGSLSYKSSNSNVVKVSSYGWIDAKNCGKATITIKASETTNYKAATKKITVTVVPKTAALTTAASPDHKKLSLKWRKDKNVTGYEVNISEKKNFKSHTIKRTYKASQTSTVITNVPEKTYYVRIRSYKKVGKKKYYSNWSKTKSVKIN